MGTEAIQSFFSEDITSTFNKIKAGVLFTDEEKNIIFANKKFLKIFNTDLDSVKKEKCWNLLHPDSPSCDVCEDADNIHLKVNINGNKYHMLISNSHLGNHIEMSVIHEVTRIMSEIDKLTVEMDGLREIIKNTFGSYNFLIACSDCHKIRLEDGTWVNPADMDAIMEKTGISHGLCPQCAKPYLEGLLKNKK